MTDFLRMLLGVSLTGGVFILAAILIRAGVKNRMPKHFLVLLWAAVLLHLLLLVGTPSPTSIYNFVTFQPPAALEQAVHHEDLALPAPTEPAGDMAASRATPERAASSDSPGWANLLLFVWIAGMAILGAGFAVAYWTTRKRFADAMLLKNDPIVERWLRERKRSVKVYVSDRTTTPLSCGLFRPRIILPFDMARENAAQVESVLEHEYIHGSHYHNAMKVLVAVAVLVHWFNPVVWLFWLLFNHDLELACDEQVLRNIGAGRRAEYAHALVAVAERVVTPLPLVSAFNARNLRERIVDVMGFKRASGYWLVPEVVLVLLLFAVFGTAPAAGNRTITPPSGITEETWVGVSVPPEFSDWTYTEGTDVLDVALSLSGGGTVIKEEVEQKNGRRLAEFKIISGRTVHTIQLDTNARTMMKYERQEPRNPITDRDLERVISMALARQIAVAAVGGGVATGVELKRTKAGGIVYEVEVLFANNEYEVELNALDGVVLEIDD